MELKNYPSGDKEFDSWFREVNPDWADEIDEQLKSKVLLNRFAEMYDFLVDQTEERKTIYNRERSHRLSDLLDLFAYLRGDEGEENPLLEWFPE